MHALRYNNDNCKHRVKPLVSGSLHISDGLRLLDPTLKRLVFASGVFFFEGQSDYRYTMIYLILLLI